MGSKRGRDTPRRNPGRPKGSRNTTSAVPAPDSKRVHLSIDKIENGYLVCGSEYKKGKGGIGDYTETKTYTPTAPDLTVSTKKG